MSIPAVTNALLARWPRMPESEMTNLRLIPLLHGDLNACRNRQVVQPD